jgi:glycosyltransferase involved in cell wall biosynthesis
MRLLLVTGIWPPDVGGPATHGPELARFLAGRGHEVAAVTMGAAEPTERPCPVHVVSRARVFPARYGLVAARTRDLALEADVVYASATYAAAALGAAAARRPLVVKLVSDPAYERARRFGLFRGSLEEFQTAGGAVPAALRGLRTRMLLGARRIVVPSVYLARLARGWGLPDRRLVVVPNATPLAERPTDVPLETSTLVFVGRLTVQKSLDVAIDAMRGLPELRLVVVGDGPERSALERRAAHAGLDGRIVFAGAAARAEVLRRLAGAFAAVLPSSWENMPHAVAEALAVGTPVVATAVGGVPEIVRDGENGLLVPPASSDALAAALRRLVEEPGLRDRLAAAAPASVANLAPELVYGRIESILEEVARR